VWVFTGSRWSDATELTANDVGGDSAALFGTPVAVSGDGQAAVIGGSGWNGAVGAAWVFTQAGGLWSQQSRLNPAAGSDGEGGEIGGGLFGDSAAIAADAPTALIGAPYNDNPAGAAWIFDAAPPVCGQVAATTPAGGGAISITLACSGPPGQTLTYAVVSGPGHGVLGTIDQTAGAVTYASVRGYSGSDSFTYVATDAEGTSTPATATITIPPAPPVCAGADLTTPAGGGAFAVQLSCTGAGPLSYDVVSSPAHGSLGPVSAGGLVTYTPPAGYSGSDSFTFTASNGGGTSTGGTGVPRRGGKHRAGWGCPGSRFSPRI
jgi:hypothetical protein